MPKPGFDILGAQRLVWESSLRSPEKLTMLALLDHWSKASRAVFPSTARLARMTSQGKRTVIRAIADLERSGALTVTRRVGQSNTYTLRPELAPKADPDQCQSGTGATESPVPERHPTGATGAPPPVPERHPKEPSEGTQVRNPYSARSTSRPKSGSSSGSSKKAKKAPAKPKAQPTPVPGAHDLKVHYVETFEKHRGAKPEFGKRWSRAVKAFGELVTTHGLDKSKTIVSRALSDSFARRIEPWNLVDDAVRWLGAQPQNANKHTVQRSLVAGWKPSTNPDWDSPDSVVTP